MRVLILDPHGDDWLFCTGIVQQHIEKNDEIMYICFSSCKKSLSNGYTEVDYQRECLLALNDIGITNFHFLEYPVREFNKHRQEILDYLVSCRKEFKPDKVYTPSSHDVHQDHQVVCRESIRAFSKFSSIFGYDMPWGVINSSINYYVELAPHEIKRKVKLSSYYKSQIDKKNNCLTPHFLQSLAIVRGNKINVEYAEGFEVIVLRD